MVLSFLQNAVFTPSAIVSGALFYLLYVVVIRPSSKKLLSPPLPQPPTTLPLIGNLFGMINNNETIHDWFLEMCTCFDVWVLRAPIGAMDSIIISSPKLLEDVLKTQFDTFAKGPFIYENLHDLLGDSMGIVDGEKWRFQRKIVANLLSAKNLRKVITSIIHKHIDVLLNVFQKKCEVQERFDLCTIMNRFTLEVFSDIAFGVHLGGLEAGESHEFEAAFDEASRIITKRFILPSAYWKLQRLFNIGDEAQLKRSMKTVNDLVLNIISKALERRRGNNTANTNNQKMKDLVSLAIDAADVTGEKQQLDPLVLRSIVLSSLFAGRDTTAQSLCWFFYLLSRHPHVEAKIRAELHEKLPLLSAGEGKNLPIHLPTMIELQEITYLEAAIKETLRLYPPGAVSSRYTNKDTVLSDGTFVLEGTTIIMSPYAMGRMTSIWGPNAADFEPERWIDPHTGKLLQVSPFKFNSFFGGPRMCVGMHLAMLEMKFVIIAVLSSFHIAVEPGQHVTYGRSLTLPMKDPLMVRIQPVNVAAL